MAVVIASDLAKDMAGEPLLRGVSFKLERRDRLTLSGRNGSGKTTLLRMLSGETGIDGGELAFQKDVRVSLHDQRPPRDRDLSLRDYVLGGLQGAARAGGADGVAGGRDGRGRDGRRDAGRLRVAPRPGWSTPAATTGASRSTRRCTGSGSATGTWTGRWRRSRGGELTRASLARALAGDPDLLLLDEPTNHLDIDVAGVAGDASAVARRRDRAGRARSLVPRGGRHGGAGARGRALEVLQGHLARLAGREGAARAGAGPRDREAAGGDRQARALRRPASGRARAPSRRPRARRSSTRSRRSGATRRTARASASRSSRPSAPGRVVFEVEDGLLKIGDRVLLQDAELWLERAEHVSLVGANGSGKTTLITALTGGREFDGGKLRTRAQRQARAARAARRGAGQGPDGARGLPARDRADAQQRAVAARAVPVQRRGRREAAGRAVAAASASGCRWRSSCTPAPTS